VRKSAFRWKRASGLTGTANAHARSALGLHWVVRLSGVQALRRLNSWWRLFNRWRRWRLFNRWRLMGRRGRLIDRAYWLMSRCGFDVLFALCSQHKPRICHREQRTLRFRIIEILDKSQASLGILPIPFYQLRHTSGPHHLKRRTFLLTALKKIRSVPRRLREMQQRVKARAADYALEIICRCISSLNVGYKTNGFISIRNTHQHSFRRSADRVRSDRSSPR